MRHRIDFRKANLDVYTTAALSLILHAPPHAIDREYNCNKSTTTFTISKLILIRFASSYPISEAHRVIRVSRRTISMRSHVRNFAAERLDVHSPSIYNGGARCRSSAVSRESNALVCWSLLRSDLAPIVSRTERKMPPARYERMSHGRAAREPTCRASCSGVQCAAYRRNGAISRRS